MKHWKVTVYGRTVSYHAIHMIRWSWLYAPTRAEAIHIALTDDPPDGVVEVTRTTARRTYRELWPGEWERITA